jgi:hypothetical protein
MERKPRSRLYRMVAEGYTFLFLIEDGQRLHISYRPGITPERAADVFFAGWHSWNAARQRFECHTETHGVYWTWLYADASSTNVLIISCFPREEEEDA